MSIHTIYFEGQEDNCGELYGELTIINPKTNINIYRYPSIKIFKAIKKYEELHYSINRMVNEIRIKYGVIIHRVKKVRNITWNYVMKIF